MDSISLTLASLLFVITYDPIGVYTLPLYLSSPPHDNVDKIKG